MSRISSAEKRSGIVPSLDLIPRLVDSNVEHVLSLLIDDTVHDRLEKTNARGEGDSRESFVADRLTNEFWCGCLRPAELRKLRP